MQSSIEDFADAAHFAPDVVAVVAGQHRKGAGAGVVFRKKADTRVAALKIDGVPVPRPGPEPEAIAVPAALVAAGLPGKCLGPHGGREQMAVQQAAPEGFDVAHGDECAAGAGALGVDAVNIGAVFPGGGTENIMVGAAGR